MAFWGHAFMFNGIPCEDYDLMLYDIGDNSQSGGRFASGVTIVEDVVSTKWKPYFYGTKTEGKLEFTIVFGANQKRLDKRKYLDRYELEAIASWLTGHNQYLWLEVEQEDLEYVRYHCIVTELEIVEYGRIPWALQATVVCDSPYAYLYPQVFEYEIYGNKEISFYNESSHNGYYMPQIEFSALDTPGYLEYLSIENVSDNGRTFLLGDDEKHLPTGIKSVSIDCDTSVITCDTGLNLYPYSNYKFLRLIKGENKLVISGNGILKIKCAFPVNVGG